jgi:hypothetical protein
MTRFSPSRRKKDVAARHENGESFAVCSECGKRVFHNKRAARAALAKLKAANARIGRVPRSEIAVMRPYPACGVGGGTSTGFHLGHRVTQGRPNLNDPRLNHLEPGSGAA